MLVLLLLLLSALSRSLLGSRHITSLSPAEQKTRLAVSQCASPGCWHGCLALCRASTPLPGM